MSTLTLRKGDAWKTHQITVKEGSQVKDLQNAYAQIVVGVETTLAVALDNSTLSIPLLSEVFPTVEVGDLIVVGDEYMLVGAHTLPDYASDAYYQFACTRGYTLPAQSPTIIFPNKINGAGTNKYRLSGDATFYIIDSGGTSQAPVVVTLPASSTSTNTKASDLVSDIQTLLNSSYPQIGTVTVTIVQDRIHIIPSATGSSSWIKLYSANTVAQNELGAPSGSLFAYGFDSKATSAVSHDAGAPVVIIKKRGPCIVDPAGQIFFEFDSQVLSLDWSGIAKIEYEVYVVGYSKFTIPVTGEYLLELIE